MPFYLMDQSLYTQNISDNGGPFKDVEQHILSGSYFFLDSKRYEHRRNVYNIVEIMATVGGLAKFILAVSDYFSSELTWNYVVEICVQKFFSTHAGIY